MPRIIECDVCGKKFEDNNPNKQSCEICQHIITKYKNGKYPPIKVREALKKAYYSKENNDLYFKCGYTGVISKFNDSAITLGGFKDSFVLTLDHEDPDEDDLVVSLNIINKMKCDIPLEKFKEIVIALGDFFKQEKDGKLIDSQKLEDALRNICDNS